MYTVLIMIAFPKRRLGSNEDGESAAIDTGDSSTDRAVLRLHDAHARMMAVMDQTESLMVTPSDAAYSKALDDNIRRAIAGEQASLNALLQLAFQLQPLPAAMRGDKQAQLAVANAFAEMGEYTWASTFHMLAGKGKGRWKPQYMALIDDERRKKCLAVLRHNIPL